MSYVIKHHNVLESDLKERLQMWLKSLTYYSGFTRRGMKIDRQQVWFHKKGTYFNTLWTEKYQRWEAHEFAEILDEVIQALHNKGITGAGDCNSCLINKYPDGNAFIPRHVDSKDSFGLEPTIINLSIGATRVLEVNDMCYPLEDNTVIVMSGPSVPHQLLRDQNCQEIRWSLTFRKHLS